MISSLSRIAAIALVATSAVLVPAEDTMHSLHGTCVIRAADDAGRFSLELNRGECQDRDCHESNIERPWSLLQGMTLEDLRHDGAHVTGAINGEAGKLTCSGVVRDLRVSGDFAFEPDQSFVASMRAAGFEGLSSEKLEAYTLFDIRMQWIRALQQAGVSGLDSDNLIAMRIFNADAGYVREMVALGYPTPAADKLIALKVQGVDPAEVKQVRALGYQPTMDELIQMRIFKITPDFIKRMQARGLGDLTIGKLVQIKIFKLAD